MSYFYGLNSSSVGALFGFGNTSSGVNNMSFLSDYASIRNGSYGKLLRAHYRSQSVAESEEKDSVSGKKEDTASKDEAVRMRDAAADLKSSANKLLDNSKDKNLFEKKAIKGEDGTTKKDYDRDAIYKAVKNFVDDYNTTIEAAGNSQNRSVLTKASSMVSLTNNMKNLLGKVGISVSSADNKLSINEDDFKKADMSQVKSLFQGTGGYAYQVGGAASGMINSSNTQIAQLSGSMYTNMGSYGSGFYSGSFYSDYF